MKKKILKEDVTQNIDELNVFEIEEIEERLDFAACVSNGNCGGCTPDPKK